MTDEPQRPPVDDPTHEPVEDSITVHDDEATDLTDPIPIDADYDDYDEGTEDPENTEAGVEPEHVRGDDVDTAELDLSTLLHPDR